MISCMGGWCRVRDTCFHYTSNLPVVQERICGRDLEHYRHLLAGAQASMSGEINHPAEAQESGTGPSGTVWRRQEVAGIRSQEPQGI